MNSLRFLHRHFTVIAAFIWSSSNASNLALIMLKPEWTLMDKNEIEIEWSKTLKCKFLFLISQLKCCCQRAKKIPKVGCELNVSQPSKFSSEDYFQSGVHEGIIAIAFTAQYTQMSESSVDKVSIVGARLKSQKFKLSFELLMASRSHIK